MLDFIVKLLDFIVKMLDFIVKMLDFLLIYFFTYFQTVCGLKKTFKSFFPMHFLKYRNVHRSYFTHKLTLGLLY